MKGRCIYHSDTQNHLFGCKNVVFRNGMFWNICGISGYYYKFMYHILPWKYEFLIRVQKHIIKCRLPNGMAGNKARPKRTSQTTTTARREAKRAKEKRLPQHCIIHRRGGCACWFFSFYLCSRVYFLHHPHGRFAGWLADWLGTPPSYAADDDSWIRERGCLFVGGISWKGKIDTRKIVNKSICRRPADCPTSVATMVTIEPQLCIPQIHTQTDTAYLFFLLSCGCDGWWSYTYPPTNHYNVVFVSLPRIFYLLSPPPFVS